MLYKKNIGVALYTLLTLVAVPELLFSASNWEGFTSSDMNTDSNWNPGGVPADVDTNFNSTLSGVNFSPSSSLGLSLLTLGFSNSAEAFTFNFDNCPLTFTGSGITGTETNTTINSKNTADAVVSTQILFSTIASTSGSATLNTTNIGTGSGTAPAISSGVIANAQIWDEFPFSMLTNGVLSASNIGTDTSTGAGGNSVGEIASAQLLFTYNTDPTAAFTAVDSATIIAVNNGVYSGSNDTTANNVGYLGGQQLLVVNPFTAGNSLTLYASNTGLDSSGTGIGGNFVGYIGAGQVELDSSFTASDNATITVLNSGTNHSIGGTAGSDSGLVIASQFTVAGAFSVGDFLNLSVSNTGIDTSNGVGSNKVGWSSNYQLQFSSTFDALDSATITAINSGSYSGLNSGSFNTVGYFNAQQFFVSGAFTAGDSLKLSASNTGTDSSTGVGGNFVGYLEYNQAEFDSSFITLENATITLSNIGTNSSSTASNSTGVISGLQFTVTGAFTAGGTLNLSASNTGTDSSTGLGGNQVGYILGQVVLGDLFTANDNATITVVNSGTDQGNGGTSGSSIGYNGGSQFSVVGAFTAGDALNLIASNTGIDSSTSSGGNNIGVISSSQLLFNSTFTTGNSAVLSATNSGNNNGINITIDINSGITIPAGSNAGHLANGYQFHFVGAFYAGNFLNLSANNSGIDSSNGSGGNNSGSIVGINCPQLLFSDIFTTGNNAVLSATNSGRNGGNNSTNGNNVGYLSSGHQFHFAGAFYAENSLNLSASNIGIDSSTGIGENNVGSLDKGQMLFDSTFNTGDNATITVYNSGTNSGFNNVGNAIGYMGYPQFSIVGAFQAGDDFTFNATNLGLDSGTSVGGNDIGFMDFHQLEFDNAFTVGDNATITVVNSGTNQSTGGTAGTNIALAGGSQFVVAGAFTAGDSLNFKSSNTGTDSSTSSGGNQVAIVNNSQLLFSSTFTTGNNAVIAATNSGINSSNNTTTANNVGYLSNFSTAYQLHFSNGFQAGHSLNLSASNVGIDSSVGIGGNNVGNISNTQMQFDNIVSIGNNTTITVSNSGAYSGNSTNNHVGTTGNPQLSVNGAFQAGNFFALIATNVGEDNGTGAGSNNVGRIDDPQAEFNSTFIAGDNATITISNSGTNSNNNADNQTGFCSGSQFTTGLSFGAGNDFNLQVTNTGISNGTIGVNSSIGYINDAQINFYGTFSVRDNATIIVSNSGTNTNNIDSINAGVISGNQFSCAGQFSARKNLLLSATNSAVNTNNTAFVGVTSSQLYFGGLCKVGDGSTLIASNNGTGTVSGSQIYFAAGFNISGKATFQAINSAQGTLTGNGIYVAAGTGGNANIILENTSFFVTTTATTFTIGELNGDSTSTAQANVPLIINTDVGVNANFSGNVLTTPFLVKSGLGTQTLAGSNLITSLTTVQGGTLILTGPLSGDVQINSLGILKGTGIVAGTILNNGIIAPGQSIGTLSMATYTNNGTYEAELDSLGNRDLINVSGSATLNGGLVSVSSVDGGYLYQTPYTIVDAASVTGQYSGASSSSSFITPTLTYDSEHVYLTIKADIESAADTYNERAVAYQLDGIVNPNALQTTLLNEIVSLSLSDARIALDSLSGWQYTSDLFVAETINGQFIKRLYDPIRSIVTSNPKQGGGCGPCEQHCSNDYSVWVEGGITHIGLNGNSNAHGLRLNGGEITAGVQKTFDCKWTFGIAGSYEHDKIHYKHSGGSGISNTWMGGLYGLYRNAHFYGLADVAYGYSLNTMNRSLQLGSLNYSAHSSPKIEQFTFYSEIGVDLYAGDFLIQPFAGIEAGANWQHQVSERNAGGWELAFAKKNRSAASSRLGFHITTARTPSNLALSLDIAWDRRLTGSQSTFNEEFVQFGNSFDIRSVKLGSNSVDYALTLSKCINNHWGFYLKGSGESWSKANSYDILGGVKYSW